MCVSNSSLQWLIDPFSRAEFFQDYWEKRPLVVKRNQPTYFGSLVSLDEVDRVLTTLDLRYPNVSLKNADRSVTAADYVQDDDSLDVAKVYQLFSEGATIVLSYLDNIVPPLTLFCRSLEREFSFPFQTNVYVTPAGAKGFKTHYDTHDVFVLQVAGSKQWTLYGTPVELPLTAQSFDSTVHERGEPTLEFELQAGDLAYIPRGVVHDARSGDAVSLHVTVGVLTYTWLDLLLEWVADAALNDSAFRKSLPPGFAAPEFDRTQARAILQSLLQRLSTKSDYEVVLERFADEFLAACPPVLTGQMAQLSRLDELTVNSMVKARRGVVYRLQADHTSTVIDCYGRRITFPAYAGEAVRFALSQSEFVVHQLPGDWDDESKLVLVRRLIREGLLVALPAGDGRVA
ncbi:MAG TPA: cupin domain-containing protein [Terriglobia bacterium]|nr:cupin domain-containing protein [Terriglobia bacterium]